METIIINIILITGVVISFILGEKLSIILPRTNSYFDRKPFNCRPCITFHIAWICTTIGSVIVRSMELFISGIISAFIVFLIVIYIDSKKIEP